MSRPRIFNQPDPTECRCPQGVEGLVAALADKPAELCPVHDATQIQRTKWEREADRLRDARDDVRAADELRRQQRAADKEADGLAQWVDELRAADPLSASIAQATGARPPATPLNASADEWAARIGADGTTNDL